MIDRAIIKAAALCTYIVTFTVWPLLWKGAFYQGLALAIMMHWVADYLPVKYPMFHKKIILCGVLCAMNNLLDELFFDPKSYQVNEYVLLFLIALIIIGGKRISGV